MVQLFRWLQTAGSDFFLTVLGYQPDIVLRMKLVDMGSEHYWYLNQNRWTRNHELPRGKNLFAKTHVKRERKLTRGLLSYICIQFWIG